MQLASPPHAATCGCPACTGATTNATGEYIGVDAFSLDPFAGQTYAGKPIWDLSQISLNLNRTGYDWYTNNYGELDDGVLNYGFWLNIQELQNSYYVNDTGTIAFNEAYYAADFSAFTAGQQTLARNSIALWDDLIDISFRETKSGSADITFGNTNTGGAQAYAYLPFGDIDDVAYFNAYGFEEVGRLGGDVWIDGFVPSNFNPLTNGFYATLTMIHELGHTLGLSHPGDYDALNDSDGDGVPDPISYANDAAFAQDSNQYTVMSYFDAYETGAQHINFNIMSFGYGSTPLIHDIAAIQAIYGADPTTRVGDTVYGFNSTAGRSAYDLTTNISPVFAIYDAGGIDTLDLSGYNTDSFISLTPGSFSSAGGADHLLTISEINANRAAIGLAPRSQATYDFYVQFAIDLGLTSYQFHDNLSIAYNTIVENAIGGGGDDILVANSAANVLTGNAGFDTASYQDATAGVIASLATGGTSGDAAGDSYVTIEGLTGSEFADQLSGDAGNNTLEGLGGADAFDGLGGIDTVTYAQAIAAVTASLLTGGTVGDAAGDTFANVENLTGGDYDDTLGGNGVANVIDGGAGIDTLFYSGATAGVVLNLGTGGTGGLATGDSYLNIENVKGTGFVDRITGDAFDNLITGGAGGDTLNGAGGIDTVVYADSGSAVTVNLTNNYAAGGTATGDHISNFENILGSGFADTLTGSAGANTISGGGGADSINGSTGNDTLYGDAGNDSLRGGNGNDTLDGGDNNDTLMGEGNNDTLLGGLGNDTLNGGNNDDSLDGQGGTNTLTGGSGIDRFVFTVLDGGKDIITDFKSGTDKIVLTGIDAIFGTPAIDAFTYIGGGAFTAAGQLHTFLDAGVFSLGGDTDGDGIADLVIGLSGITSIAAADIILV